VAGASGTSPAGTAPPPLGSADRPPYTRLEVERGTFQRAIELKKAGRLDEAVIELESLLVEQPRDPFLLTQLAHCQLRRQRPAAALEELDKAEAAGGVTAFTARLRGDVLYRLDRFKEAARAYDEADALGDTGAWVLTQLARCHLRSRDLDAARGAAARAVERDPGSAQAWTVLGDVALKAGEPEQAEAHYRKGGELDPTDQYAYARLIEARLLQLDPEERSHELEVLLRGSGRDNPYLSAALARLRRQLGDEEGAAEAWRDSRRSPGDLFARKQEGYALRRAERLDEAAVVLRECLLKEPEDVILFRTYVGLQRRRDALDELRQTLEDLLPVAGNRRGAVYGELRKLSPR
jgi:predicted Zn-dependent protease